MNYMREFDQSMQEIIPEAGKSKYGEMEEGSVYGQKEHSTAEDYTPKNQEKVSSYVRAEDGENEEILRANETENRRIRDTVNRMIAELKESIDGMDHGKEMAAKRAILDTIHQSKLLETTKSQLVDELRIVTRKDSPIEAEGTM